MTPVNVAVSEAAKPLVRSELSDLSFLSFTGSPGRTVVRSGSALLYCWSGCSPGGSSTFEISHCTTPSECRDPEPVQPCHVVTMRVRFPGLNTTAPPSPPLRWYHVGPPNPTQQPLSWKPPAVTHGYVGCTVTS